MEKKFKDFIISKSLFEDGDRIIAAVSGGVDSMVLVHLLHNMGVNLVIAHCNFQLRNNDADADEEFVSRLSEQLAVPFYSKKFDTKAYATRCGISVQMAARELRYTWFEELRLELNAGHIATAHHRDDEAETFFINLARGTGIRGLSGMDPKNGCVVRPLLFADKREIMDFARATKIAYREDASNKEDLYERNFIRHHVIPEMEKLNPGFTNTMHQTMDKLRAAKEVYEAFLDGYRAAVTEDGGTVKIAISGFSGHPLAVHILYELIAPYGFSGPDAANIIRAFEEPPGKQFFSGTHRLIKDRDSLFIDLISASGNEEAAWMIGSGRVHISTPVSLSFEIKKADGLVIPALDHIACLDNEKLCYPLKLRKWVHGDYMYPLGMKGRKKLSDVFIDRKVPLNKKDNIFVLESGGEIAWVVGYRIDERFKITKATKQACLITVLDR